MKQCSMKSMFVAGVASLAVAVASEALAEADITLSGPISADRTITCTTATRVRLNGVTFTDASLKLKSAKDDVGVTFTLELVNGTENIFKMTGENHEDDEDWNASECIKATKLSNIVIEGTGSLDLLSEKRITDGKDKDGNKKRSGILVCNNLTVNEGDIRVTYDQDKTLTSCIFLKGNYLQSGGKVKLDLHKKNSTNEFHGVTFDSASTTFTLGGGEFKAEIAGTKSRAIDLKNSGKAYFKGGEVKAEFEGPEGRFVNGGSLIQFEGGSYAFTTNVTSKMTAAYYPKKLKAVNAYNAIKIIGGKFEADLPLEGSEIFTNDGTDGTDITISGGDFDLVAGDDCISANEDIVISGGSFRCRSTLDDVFDANQDLTISGGDIRAWATAPGTHAFDVNAKKKRTLTISGGIVVGTDGIGAEPIGSGSSEVGKVSFIQPTYYGSYLSTVGYSGKYLTVSGETNGVPFTIKPRLPDFPEGKTFNLLVSLPGRTASAPVPQSAQEAYADANSVTPLVFERKATVDDHTVTTKEGDVISLPEYYDLSPNEGKTKVVSLTLNEKAEPEIKAMAADGESQVRVSVDTMPGLYYGLQSKDDLSENWTPPAAWVDGDGTVKALSAAKSGQAGFYQAVATDVK